MSDERAREIAGKLTAQDRDFLLETPGRAPASAATARRCEELGLYEWIAGFADWIRWTDLGLAVRRILEEGNNGNR